MRKKIIIAFSTIFLLNSVISTVIYADDLATPKAKTIRMYQTVDPDTYT